MRYQFISGHSKQFPITLMCRVLGVSCSGYYAWRSRLPGQRAQENRVLDLAVRAAFKASQNRYGSPRIFRELRDEGKVRSENRVARLMRAAGLKARNPRRFVVTTDSRHGSPVAANVLNRQFQVAAPNLAWVSDITYVPTARGWLYLAVVIDLYSRRVIGWSLSNTLRAGIVVEALKMSVKNRVGQNLRGLVFHSDQGSQFVSEPLRAMVTNSGMTQSMSRRGNCWDNAPAESFFSTLKTELIYRRRYATMEQARADIFHYIEVFYNRKRRHSALDYLSPVEYERRQEQSHRSAREKQTLQNTA